MGLDFVAVTENRDVSDAPSVVVRLNLAEHDMLLADIDHRRFPLLARMHDYYGDVVYRRRELHDLQLELQELASSVSAGRQRRIVDAMETLTREALALGLRVEAIAD